MTSSSLALFEQQQVRRIEHDWKWYFSLDDVILALVPTKDVRQYIKKMKSRDEMLFLNWGTLCTPLPMIAKDGKKRKVLCADTESLFRIIQSIPSPKAEPFKLWLAQVWYQRMQEIEDPELAQERMKQLYEAKGYSKDRIDKRLRGIAIRQNLTDEWKERWLTSQSDYAILTSEISQATFGMTPTEYKEYKWLAKKWDNLRDHMTDFELIFTMLWEKVTTEISHKEKPKTMPAHKKVARRGGNAAKVARKATEKEIGKSIVSEENYKQKLP